MNRTIAVLTGVCALTSVAAATGSPLAWWKFDEASGTTAADQGPFNITGTLSGGASFAPGISGNSVFLPGGPTDFVNMGLFLQNLGTDFSLQAWIKTTNRSSASTIVVGRHDTGYFNGYMMRVNQDLATYGATDRASFYQSNSPANTAVGTSVVTDGVWHHLLATYQAGGSLTLWVDGVAQAVIPASAIGGNSVPFMVGGVTSAGNQINAFAGYVDEAQYYDYTLSPAQVQFLANNPGAAIPSPAAFALAGAAGLLAAARRRR